MDMTTLIGLAAIAVIFAGWMIARAQRRQRTAQSRMGLLRRTVDPIRGGVHMRPDAEHGAS
jgi:hypothetical protein